MTEDTRYECIWIWLRPNRLPRPLSGIALCVVYNLLDRGVQEQRDLKEYLSRTIDTIWNKYSHFDIPASSPALSYCCDVNSTAVRVASHACAIYLLCICALGSAWQKPYQKLERSVKSGADVLFSNCWPGDDIIFVRNGKYREFFENNIHRRQTRVNFFL